MDFGILVSHTWTIYLCDICKPIGEIDQVLNMIHGTNPKFSSSIPSLTSYPMVPSFNEARILFADGGTPQGLRIWRIRGSHGRNVGLVHHLPQQSGAPPDGRSVPNAAPLGSGSGGSHR